MTYQLPLVILCQKWLFLFFFFYLCDSEEINCVLRQKVSVKLYLRLYFIGVNIVNIFFCLIRLEIFFLIYSKKKQNKKKIIVENLCQFLRKIFWKQLIWEGVSGHSSWLELNFTKSSILSTTRMIISITFSEANPKICKNKIIIKNVFHDINLFAIRTA